MATRDASNGSRTAASRFGSAIRDSTLLKLAATGTLCVFVAVVVEVAIRMALLNRGLAGVWAAVLVTWGLGMVLVGVAGSAFVRWRRR